MIVGDRAVKKSPLSNIVAFGGLFVLSFTLFAFAGLLQEASPKYIARISPEMLEAALTETVVEEAPPEDLRRSETEETSTAESFSENVAAGAHATYQYGGSFPTRISIPAVNIDFMIVNPKESDIAVLDAALFDGVVRYPLSGVLTSDAPMFLFGHSSHLPVVHNKAFQAFNNLEKVRVGDMVFVYNGTTEYRYRARKVTLADADDALVVLGGGGKGLTLSTCNNFGEKQERFVVEADFVGAFSLSR